MLTIAVLSILVTAPIGAIAIVTSGPRLLTKDSADKGNERVIPNTGLTAESLLHDEQDLASGRMTGQSELTRMLSSTANPQYEGGDETIANT